jgi:molybdopterin-containing oxidoreductase family membrane subunit
LQVWHELLTSPWFWIETGLGLAVPLVLMLGRSRVSGGAQVLSAVLVLIGGFIGRYDFIIGGQKVPLFKGNWVPGLIEYAPSFTEWMLLVLAVSIVFSVYAVGERQFDLSALPSQSGGPGRAASSSTRAAH